MKRLLVAALYFSSVMCIPFQQSHAANTDIFALQGGGAFNNVDVFAVDKNGVVNVSSSNAANFTPIVHTTLSNQGVLTLTNNESINNAADLYMGSSSIAISTTNTSQSSQGMIFTGFLDVGGSSVAAVVEGSAVCASTVTNLNNNVTLMACPTVLGDIAFVGVAVTAASTGSVVNVYNAGWVLARTTGTVLPGDGIVVSSQSVGVFEHYTSNQSSAAIIGVALGGATNGAGAVLTRISLK